MSGFPTLFIAGQNSDYCTAAHMDAAAQYFHSPRRLQIDGAGHWVHADKQDVFVDALCSELQAS